MRNQLLRDSDWASMAHSLEIRVPLVDIPLLGEVMSLSHAGYNMSKQDMAAAAGDVLPLEAINRPKTGFSIPVRQWLGGKSDQPYMAERGYRGWAKFVLEKALEPSYQ